MRRFLPMVMIVVTLLIDVSIMPALAHHWAIPLTLLPTVIVLGLLLGRTRGLLCGMVGGLLIDILVSYPLGLMAILYLIAGYLSGVAGRKFQRYLLTVVLAPMVSLIIFELAMMGYQFMAGHAMTLTMLRNAGVRILIETLLAQLLYLLYNRLLKPSWSRYAAR